jgi:hypothetical protein
MPVARPAKQTAEERNARDRERRRQRKLEAAAARAAAVRMWWAIGGVTVVLLVGVGVVMWANSTDPPGPPAYTPDGRHICNDGWVSPSDGPGTSSSHGGER